MLVDKSSLTAKTPTPVWRIVDAQKPAPGFFTPTVRTKLNLLVAYVLLVRLFPLGIREV